MNVRYTKKQYTDSTDVCPYFVLFHLYLEPLLTTYVKLFPANLLHKAMLKACRRLIIVACDKKERRREREKERITYLNRLLP